MPAESTSPLDRARRKAFFRLLPVLFVSYMIAYVDRQNVAVAKLTMVKDMPAFTDAVIGFGAGIFFLGYFLLEIPGTLMVERWSARKWICRIMVSWGIMAACTAYVQTPTHFYIVRFLLGLAEAGFFPGVIVYLTHWFTSRDRAKALSYFLIATPFAQMISPKISFWILTIGSGSCPRMFEWMGESRLGSAFGSLLDGWLIKLHMLMEQTGLVGWQWVYIFWGIPAVLLGVSLLWLLTDRPRQAKWLTPEEAEALEAELERERQLKTSGKRMTVLEAFRHPKVMLLCAAYFFTVMCSYSMEFFMPSVINEWYQMSMNKLTWLIILPPTLALCGQLFGGWSSDRFQERRLHACLPIAMGAIAMLCAPFTKGNLPLTIACFMVAFAGFKMYMPAFWSLPSLFLAEAAAAGSIGLINSVGNLGGLAGPTLMGWVKTNTGSFDNGFYVLCGSMLVSSSIIFFLGLGIRQPSKPS